VSALLLAASLAASAGPASIDLAPARTAWLYFQRNTDPTTGLVRSVDGYPNTSAWDQGSALIAAVAARELGLVEPGEFDEHVRRLLRTLATQPLYDGVLPNKAYDTRSGRMTDYRNAPAPKGIGFSAIDLGRLVSALVLLGELHPAHRHAVERVLSRWDLCRVIKAGELHGEHASAGGAAQDAQEGRLGYEQYAAKGFALLGRDAAMARRYDRFASEVEILGVPVPRDRRDARTYGAVDAVETEPWVLDAIEFGLDPDAAPLARRIFEVQKRRWETTGVVTALTEGHLDRPPWFVYDGIWADGRAWRTVSPEGTAVTGLRQLWAKAAFTLAALYPEDPYAAVLRGAAEAARDPERGWYAGVYERDGELNRALDANTNGAILEATLFATAGPLHAMAASRPGAAAWRAALAFVVRPAPSCLSTASVVGQGAGTGAGAGDGIAGPGAAALEPPRLARPRHVLATGTVFLDYRGNDLGGTGALATVFPYGFWFVRGGGEWTPYSPFSRSRFLWGFGYDDWHDGTFSATVHNWGPIRTEGEVGPDRAELNLGYKTPRLCARALCLGAYPSLTVPFNGGPWVSGRLTLTLSGRWFVMGGLGWTIPGVFPAPLGQPTGHVFWGIGLQSWRSGSLFLTYYDWGPDARQRTGSGDLAFGVNWQF
jgi:hypothetical protein